ncbi:MAG: NUDIX domain-containing protein [Coprobacillus sp.]|nr:NUDIX domain-containing protein [Coprobacillus sp.]
MEILDIVDEKGNPVGKTIEREIAHQQGILHRTAHVWLLRKKQQKIQILLQKRSHFKDSFPDCYDISSAGHIPTGIDFIPSAIRELKEELGYCAQEKDFIYCGTRRFEFKGIFHDKPFYDNQVSHVYILWVNQDEENFTLQKEEVSQIKWFDFDDCIDKVKHNLIKHCIYLEELEIVKKGIQND